MICSLTAPAISWAACADTEGDRLVWARERMFPAATRRQTDLVYQYLLNSTRSCNGSGDLWYYRGLVARKLGNTSDANYAFTKADENNSKAKGQGFDPFAIGVTVRVSAPNHIREKYALVVGIHKFKKSENTLRYAARDAQALADALVASQNFKKDNVKVILDEAATTGAIQSALGEIRQKAKPDDLVVVYVSSHGIPRGEDPTGLSYVMTADYDETDYGSRFSTTLKMVELAEFGRWVAANNYVLLLDTCYSGAAQPVVASQIVPGGGDGLDPLQSLQGSANRVVISASRADEESIEDTSTRHGLFTRYLLDALNQKGDPDLATVFQSLQNRVTAEAEKNNKHQHPVMLAYGLGKEISLGAPLLAGLIPAFNSFVPSILGFSSDF